MANHAHLARALLRLDDGFGISQIVGKRNLDQDVLPGFHAGDRLCRMHLCRGGQDHSVDLVER